MVQEGYGGHGGVRLRNMRSGAREIPFGFTSGQALRLLEKTRALGNDAE
jgi:hypothetical protein